MIGYLSQQVARLLKQGKYGGSSLNQGENVIAPMFPPRRIRPMRMPSMDPGCQVSSCSIENVFSPGGWSNAHNGREDA